MKTTAETSPKRGRPRSSGRQKATLRLTPDDLRRLRKSADANHRSLSEELETRVRESFQTDRREEMIELMREARQSALNDLRQSNAAAVELQHAQAALTEAMTAFRAERATHEQHLGQLIEAHEHRLAELAREQTEQKHKLFDLIEIAVATAVTNVLEGKVLKDDGRST